MVQDAPVVSERRKTEFETFHLEFVSGDVVLQRHSVRLFLLDVVDELAGQLDVMNARYLSQLALVTDMVDASNLKLNAELSEVDARINIVYAYYRMKYVAGEI
jgi:hypothetical protein